ncbi:unnamed protein product [Wuchereria bancrofti]|uniref:BPTI/Kunitz inhibitor domain-containing protein n=1 Tax=Wuchereria bancrofti TaxID=6293 RepID=A0A3P7DUK9_WUCBA|nr:unnamed protein product [Wuchereria bancrofti]
MDATYALLLIVFLPAFNKAATSTGGTIFKLIATLSNDRNHPCQQPLQRGNCSQRIPLFYYNIRDHKCRKFMYSGCNGNENRFLNRRQCQAKCGRKQKFRVKQHFPSHSICSQPFDLRYRKLCRQTTPITPTWELRYFYDAKENRCRRFWYGGCKILRRNQNIFANEKACKLLCVRKESGKLEDKRKNSMLKKTMCFVKFDTNQHYGCKTFNWRPRFFYNQTSSKCEMFWYDISCSKRREVTNMFYHRGVCKRLCEQSDRMTQKSSKRIGTDTYRIGKISAMFSQPYSSMRSNSHRKLIRMRNIFDANSTSTINPSGILGIHSYANETSIDDNASSFDFHILKAEFRRSLQKVFPRSVEENNDTMNRFDQFKPILSKISKCGEFDPKLADACNITNWTARYYYDTKSNKCRTFWSSGCISDNSNNFENIASCQKQCVIKWFNSEAEVEADKGHTLPSALITRCLEPLILGNCSKMYPSYYYNREAHRCEPFIYSGCDGNLNRFLTLRQCQTTCYQFRGLSPLEMNCLLPLDGGEQIEEGKCAEKAGTRYYYNQRNERCEQFWYSGCAGNENRFYDLSTCETVCRNIPTEYAPENFSHPKVCFEPITEGKCLKNNRKSVQRWAYNHVQLQCVTFNYSGCNGNQNRFATEYSCNALCKGLKRPLQERCIAYPDWGNCNQLNYQWFYNLTKGTCEQFLWGGCNDGNENRFDTFEKCQQICEIPTKNECSDPLDRGRWCESMSNRYYYNSETNTCRGFHYTGCGKSQNIFMTQQACEEKCINQTNMSSSLSSLDIISSGQINYRGVKPFVKNISSTHQILMADSAPYIKTDAEWLEDGKCVGYRYNITGKRTRLMSYLCLMESGGTCNTQTLSTTNGDEKCRLIQPWLKGMHLYSWFFIIDQQPYPIGKQALNETTATLIILPPNDCHRVC